MTEEGQTSQRVDRWLWYARFLKSRTLANTLVQTGKLRVNGQRISKPSKLVQAGDILTFPLGPHIRVIEITMLGTRRGPASEAVGLYKDLEPPQRQSLTSDNESESHAARPRGSGRPTKKDARQIHALKLDEA